MADFYIVPPRLLVGSFDRAAVVNSINTLKGDLTFTADPLSGVKIVASGNNLQFGLITDFYVKRSGDTIFGNLNFVPAGTSYGLSVAAKSSDPGTGTTGAIYFNTTSNELKIYDNTGWNSLQSTAGISEAYANTKYLRLDGTNTPTANLTMGSVLLRLGNLATQVSAGLSGQIYFNTDTNQINLYNGSSWTPIGLGITNISVGFGLTSSQSPIVSTSSLAVNLAANFTWTGNHIFNQPVEFAAAGQSFAINKLFISGQTNGDLITFSSGAWNRFPIGTADYVLTVNSSGTGVSWKPASTASGNVGQGSQFDIAYYKDAGTAVTSAIDLEFDPSFGLFVNKSTQSTNPYSGSIRTLGGIGVSGNASIGQTLLFFNSTNSNYIGFKAGATNSSVTYTLPTIAATGNSILQSDGSGVLSWIPFSGNVSSIATTAANVNLVNTSEDNSFYLIFSKNQSGSGVALSSGAGITVNPSTSTISASRITADSISGILSTSLQSNVIGVGIVTSGTWSATAITSLYGGTGFTNYALGDLLVGNGSSSLSLLNKGSEKYVLTSSAIFPNGIGWTYVTGVAVTQFPPSNPNNADLWWNDNDGSLSIYYNDGNGSPQWVEIITGFVTPGNVIGIINNTVDQKVTITYDSQSTSLDTGSLILNGGLAVTGNVSIGNTLLFWNETDPYYIGFKASSATSSTTYILPPSTPNSALGSSVLSSDIDGTMSWVPFPSSSGNVGQGNTYELGWYFSSGSAITSSGAGLTWNKNTNLLSIYGQDAKIAIGLSTGNFEKKTGLVLENYAEPDNNVIYDTYSPSLQFINKSWIEDTATVGTAIWEFNSATSFSNSPPINGESEFYLSYDIKGYTHTVLSSIAYTNSTINEFNLFDFSNFWESVNFKKYITVDAEAFIGTTLYFGTGSVRTGFTQSPSATGIKTYILPSGYPSGVGISVLSSNSTGSLSWIGISAAAGATGSVDYGLINSIPFYVSTGTAITGSNNLFNVGTGITITNTTTSTGSSTGALVVKGGVGIAGTTFIGGSLNIESGNEFRIFDPGNTNYFGLKFTGATQKTYIFPSDTPGTGNSVLQSDTSGNLSWVPMVSAGSGNGTVDNGLVNQLSYYPATGTAVTGATGLTYSTGTSTLFATNFNGTLTGFATTARNLNTVSTTAATSDHYILFSPSNGASGVAVSSGLGLSYNPSSNTFKVGGLGISASLFTTTAATLNIFNTTATTINAFQAGTAVSIGAATGTLTLNNAITRINQSTASTSSSTGALVVIGGAGIGGSLNVGGTASNISNLIINNSVITSGNWAGSAITVRYGGTGLTSYTKGDLLVGSGGTFIPLAVGSNNYVLKADSATSSGLNWGLLDNNSLSNPTFSIGSASTSLGSTIGIVAGAGISFLYSDHSITIYNRSGVLITSDYPVSPLQGDLFWHDEEGVLKIYYDDNDGAGQWVDANQRWGQGQYVTFPDLGAGDIYEVAYYSAAGHSVGGANNFTNNTSTNQVSITYATGSTSKSTGALTVSGGVGIGGSLFANTVVSSTGFVENVYAGGTAGTGSTIYPNWNNGSVQTFTITGNCWLGLPTNMPTGASLTLVVSQNSVGGWAMTSDSNIKYAGGLKTLSTSANAIDVINMFNTGSTYLAALTTGYS